jgi:hypothetical protein
MELVKRLGLGCVGFLIMYLMCSFYNITFDISKWSAESRFIATMLGGFCFTMLATFPNYDFKKK